METVLEFLLEFVFFFYLPFILTYIYLPVRQIFSGTNHFFIILLISRFIYLYVVN